MICETTVDFMFRGKEFTASAPVSITGINSYIQVEDILIRHKDTNRDVSSRVFDAVIDCYECGILDRLGLVALYASEEI